MALALLGSFPSSASAGGVEATVAGARSVGRGGALIAASEGFDALRYNPARLAVGNRWSIGADAQLHIDRTCYDRADLEGTTYPRVCNEAAPGIIPQLGVRGPLGDRFGFGIGVLPPPGTAGLEFANHVDGTISTSQGRVPSPARYAMASAHNLGFFITAGVGAQVHEKVRIGLAFGWGIFMLENIVFTAGLPDAGPVQDVRTALSGVDRFVPRIQLAFDVEPVEGFQISSVTQWTGDLHADAALFISGANAGEGYSARIDNVEVTQPFGFQQWLALRYSKPRWDIEVDGILQANGRAQEVTVDIPDDAELPVNGTVGGEPIRVLPDERTIARHWRHQLVLRIGGEGEVVRDRLRLRTGLSYETSGVEHGYESVDNLPLRAIGIHAGFSVNVSRSIELTAGYSRVFRATTTVDPADARIEQSVGVRPGGLADDHIFVNGGTYRSGLHVIALGIVVRPAASEESQ